MYCRKKYSKLFSQLYEVGLRKQVFFSIRIKLLVFALKCMLKYLTNKITSVMSVFIDAKFPFTKLPSTASTGLY